ncbi:hypothetical protein [Kitasatospora cheerisanensis]|uniref:Uncharacterized protein n=1 Tax=Kitasatospora cheerisanensis KCTC 2395 TaxID=1348663 RepID=A0A066ZCD5_9ACTN|nr:hypothetical protein [Kitasatospora cheerisanensis]KDN87981.1 hypothetical protein KCH_02550 [Kitasatospora cheerisanensis KCTC 2395]
MAEHHDPSAEHRRTRAALASTAERLVHLLQSTRESGARPVLPGWSVADVGAHVAAVFLAYCSSVSSEDTVDWDELLPTADLPFGPRMAVVNGRAVTMLGRQLDGDAAGFVAARTARFLRATADLAPETPVATPWYGPGRPSPSRLRPACCSANAWCTAGTSPAPPARPGGSRRSTQRSSSGRPCRS